MTTKSVVSHHQETTRNLGTLFVDVSIDQAARKAVRAAVSWGGLAVVICDAAGFCTAHMAGMNATNRIIKLAPHAVVGTYHINGDDKRSAAMRETRQQIAEDIQHHWQGLCEGRAAA